MNLFTRHAYFISENNLGLIDLDNYPIRCLAEDLGFLRGYAVCDVMEGFGRAIFHEQDHLNRLIRGMIDLSISFPRKFSGFQLKDSISRGVREIVSSDNIDFPYLVKIYVTAGGSDDGFLPKDDLTNIWIFISRFIGRSGYPPLTLSAVNHKREMPSVKTTSYAFASSTLRTEFYYDDILYCDEEFVLETSTANIFFIKPVIRGTVLVKTPPAYKVLKGITRSIVMDLLKYDMKYSFKVEEGPVAVDELSSFCGSFLTSTTRFVAPVKQIFFRDNVSKLYDSAAMTAVINEIRRRFVQYRDICYAITRSYSEGLVLQKTEVDKRIK